MTDAESIAALSAEFAAVLAPFGAAPAAVAAAWAELASQYEARGRHYHTLAHLLHLLAELRPYRAAVGEDWPALALAVFYHDAIYNPRRSDNEEKSAALAVARLPKLNVPAAVVARCEALILATRHTRDLPAAADRPTQLFLDADLAILGAAPAGYAAYAAQVRREYGWFPDIIYRPGRRKVLAHFLAQPQLFRTLEFRSRYEAAARRNLAAELTELG